MSVDKDRSETANGLESLSDRSVRRSVARQKIRVSNLIRLASVLPLVTLLAESLRHRPVVTSGVRPADYATEPIMQQS